MRESKILKAVAAIVLSLSIFVSILSGIAMLEIYKQRGWDANNAQGLYDSYMERLVQEKEEVALQYYKAVLEYEQGLDMEHTLNYYESFFSEKNSNFYFKIIPADKKYPTLQNYDAKLCRYQTAKQEVVEINGLEKTLTYQLPLETVIAYWKQEAQTFLSSEEDAEMEFVVGKDEIPQEIQDMYGSWEAITVDDLLVELDEYGNGESEIGPVITLPGTGYSYVLNQNADFSAFMEKQLALTEQETFFYQGVSYDSSQEALVLNIQTNRELKVTANLYIKSELTANDVFANSFLLRYCKTIVTMIPYVFLIAVILMLVTMGYLIFASGYHKGETWAVCNLFDRIPYDIIVIAACIYASGWYENLYSQSYGMQVVCIGFLSLFVPPLLMTSATRLKVDGFQMFKNTLCWKFVVLCKRVFVSTWRKGKQLGSFLGTHLNLYWKWAGLYFLLEFFKLLLAIADGADFGWFVILDLLLTCAIGMALIVIIVQLYKLKLGAEKIAEGQTEYVIDTETMPRELKAHGETLNTIQDSVKVAVEERMKSERMKTELITNVSHDIKTPLTSIISYVDLLSKEEGMNETQKEYLAVLERQSVRLKKLIEDLIEASKASTGNLEVHMQSVNAETLLEQALGEFEGRFAGAELIPVVTNHLAKKTGETEPAYVWADGRYLWRVFDNLIGNIVKYAQPGSRVYMDIMEAEKEKQVQIVFKNISKEPLNISGEELMERFVRGDASRNTEGNGLGLTIAKSLMELQDGKVEIMIDGDLFKVVLLLSMAK